MAHLLDAPQVLGQAAAGRARDQHDLGTVEAECPGTFREVPVVADVHADLADRRLEHRVAEVARAEVELLPEALDVRDVGLSVLAEVAPVGVDDRGRVVVDSGGGLVLLVHRRDDDHAGLLGEILHALRRRPVGDQFRVAVVLRILHLAEVGPVEELLEEHHLGALRRRVVGVALVLLDHRFLVAGPGRLEQGAANDARHRATSGCAPGRDDGPGAGRSVAREYTGQ